MNIRTVGTAPVPLAWAFRLSGLGWVAVGVEAFLVNLLSYKAFAALVGAAILTSGCAALKYLGQQIEAALDRHAERMEKITRTHADIMNGQVLAIERWFKLGVRSDDAARRDAADVHVRNGTGPFQMYRGGAQ
ncbi:hypothetical protein [Streptosporangium sp. NPDC002721]|uniref:hypothetical protein n=1 Tax=Streptosporangium sp. NPDC002721 TaxID=3366188 RepID=UPI003684ECA7